MALAAISYPPQFAPANLRSAIQPRRSSARHPSPPTSSTVAADVVAGPRPRSNPHSARAADSPPTAVSSLGGFRTPAPGACGAVVMGPASENLHIHVAVIHRRAVIHVRSAPDSDRLLCEGRNDAKGQSTKSLCDIGGCGLVLSAFPRKEIVDGWFTTHDWPQDDPPAR